jgi:hypothetical protein
VKVISETSVVNGTKPVSPLSANVMLNESSCGAHLWPVINHHFRPAASHIRSRPIETDRLSMRIGLQTQREQIGKTKGSLDVEPVVRFQPDADRECCGGEAL